MTGQNASGKRPETSNRSEEEKYEDAIISEDQVPQYELPRLLTTFTGEPVDSREQWEESRRPEIVDFFASNLYGRLPDTPIDKAFETVDEDSLYMEGLCTKRIIRITLSNDNGSVDMKLMTVVPNDVPGRVPAVFEVGGDNIGRGRYELNNSQRYGHFLNGVPIRQLVLRGIGFVGADLSDLVTGNPRAERPAGGVIDLASVPETRDDVARNVGLIAIGASGLSCGMDYLQTRREIDADKVAIMGCSISGKIAAWTAATDRRFGMALLSSAGHGGDAIWRRRFGETLENMCEWLPGYLSERAQTYSGRVSDLPVDQHMLLASIAPRPMFITGGEYDFWADPKGGWISAYHAAKAYELYGVPVAFASESQPDVGDTIMDGGIGYSFRTGFHGTDERDWENYMAFMEIHFMGIRPREAHEIYYPGGELIDHYPNKLHGSRSQERSR